MAFYILDDAGFVTGTIDAAGQPGNSTGIAPPAGAQIPLQFIAGAWVMQPPPAFQISVAALYRRLTQQERTNIRFASQNDFNVADFMMMAGASKYIDLRDGELHDGLNYLAAVGLLDAYRPAEILTSPVLDIEQP